MRYFSQFVWAPLMVFLALAQGCALIPEETPEKSPPIGLIVTPPTYYSTQKAKYLGYKYQENLSRLIERIVRDPKTANLQFANNIASVGGIGFFTHSAAKVPDERYLEVILAAPETFEKKGDYSNKLHRLVSVYGRELLTILSSDGEIYREKQVAGYGLNFSWRTIVSEVSGPRVIVERAIAYFPKEEVREFLSNKVVENNLLRDAVIFVAEADGPMSLVSYRPRERKPDFRPPIQEEIIAEGQEKPHDEPKAVAAPKPDSRGQTGRDKGKETPAKPAARETRQGEVASKTPAPKLESKRATTEKPERDLAMASSAPEPAVKDEAGREAAPERNPVQQPGIQKPAPPASKPAERKEAKASPPPSSHGAPAEGLASASSPAYSSVIQTKTTGIRPEKAEVPGTGSHPTSKLKKVEQEKDLPVLRPTEKKAPPVTSETHPVGIARVSPVVEPPVEVKAAGARSEPVSKARGTDEGRSSEPVSKPEIKPVEEKVSQPPRDSTLPKASPASLASLESHHQAEPVQTHPAPPVPMKKEARDDRPQPSTPKSADKLHPVARPAPGRAEASPNSGGPARQKARESQPVVIATAEEEKAETKVPALAGEGKTEPKPNSESRSITKERVEPLPAAVARTERPVVEKTVALPAPPVAPSKHKATSPDRTADRRAGQKVALLTKKPSARLEKEKAGMQPAPRMLKGYIIQIAFMDQATAQRWAETMERRGYAVSVTKAGGSGSLRVRIGNFPMRHEAERELKSLAKNGLNGIVLNLPDGYKPSGSASKGPEVRSQKTGE